MRFGLNLVTANVALSNSLSIPVTDFVTKRTIRQLAYTVELQWLEHYVWNHEICPRQGWFELMSVNHSARS